MIWNQFHRYERWLRRRHACVEKDSRLVTAIGVRRLTNMVLGEYCPEGHTNTAHSDSIGIAAIRF
jgi:hypothetical protein